MTIRERARKVKEKKKRKSEGKKNFYARSSEIKRVMFSHQPMIVLLYKDAFSNTNELDPILPSSIIFLL